MPGKHVRFAETNLLYSPLPMTPSPLLDSTPLPPCSSPPQKFIDSHEEVSPLCLASDLCQTEPETLAELNPILRFTLATPPIDYDISLPPTFITTPHQHILPEPAVVPPLPLLAVVCPDIPWLITVSPSSSKPDAFVTVADVLLTIYCGLRLAVHPDEYNALPSHEDKHKVNAAYGNRYVRIADHAACEEEKRKGVKRVDFLMGRTRFLGLSRTPVGPDVWALHVA
jgi:hypothetical protein